MENAFPDWMQGWLGVIVPALQIIAIIAVAWLLQLLLRRLIRRLAGRYGLPADLRMVARRISAFVIYAAALLLILERSGVSGTVLWTAFTSFAAVAAVAFFAAWSVLSNIFCALLIFTSRPFRLHDRIELLEGGDKPGLAGEVIDINLVYTSLREYTGDHAGAVLRVPNSLFFQRILRRQPGPPPAAVPVSVRQATDENV
ncbi:MAG: mechanosensitive ion channel family protein [Xanthomonadales bacterium]|nr:mechanosensitive ion channel family protein [Xanthomonadales bacterium]